MTRLAGCAAAIGALLVPLTSFGEDIDQRCTTMDRAIAEKLREIIKHDEVSDRPAVNEAMARIASARFDCKRGHIERGLNTYQQVEAALITLDKRASTH